MDSATQFREACRAGAERLGVALPPVQLEQMWHHFQMLLQANRAINLTRITEPVAAAVKHYVDSLAVVRWLQVVRESGGVDTLVGAGGTRLPEVDAALQVLDVGSGGGFPGLVLAIHCPSWQITAVEGTGRKARCLAAFVERLGLQNCRVQNLRAEQWPAPVPTFELICFRAVGPLLKCLGTARRLSGPRGIVACYKGDPLPPAEQRQAQRRARGLGFEAMPFWPYPLECAGRTLQHQLCCYRRATEPPA